jgi:uncharacterized protein YjiS (DUF1127 family)
MKYNTETLTLHGGRISLSSMLLRGLQMIVSWHERSRQRQHLAQFDERMLRDIGIRRSDVVFETTKPFWRT